MTNKLTILAAIVFLALTGVFFPVRAGIVPVLSLSYYQPTNSVQITVNADPDASVQLYYNSYQYNSGTFLATIGYTDNYGNFYMTVNSNYDNIPVNSEVYVVVDGTSSPQFPWPAYNNNNYNNNYGNNNYGNYSYYSPQPNYTPQYYPPISLSQESVSLNAGQSTTISITGSGNYYLSDISNSSVASGSINGNILDIYTYNPGSATFNVCEYGGSCSSVYVTVQAVYTPPPVITYYTPPPTYINYTPPPVYYAQPSYYTVPVSYQMIRGPYVHPYIRGYYRGYYPSYNTFPRW
jgi:hypothetical protein